MYDWSHAVEAFTLYTTHNLKICLFSNTIYVFIIRYNGPDITRSAQIKVIIRKSWKINENFRMSHSQRFPFKPCPFQE